MHLNNAPQATGQLNITLYGPDGSVKDERQVDNLVVTTGLGWLTSRAAAASPPAAMGWMAVGTNSTAAALANTTLGAEVGRTATATPTVSANQQTYSATFGAGVGTGALTEAGIFNASSAGTMLSRTVFGVITKGSLDVLVINWTITLN